MIDTLTVEFAIVFMRFPHYNLIYLSLCGFPQRYISSRSMFMDARGVMGSEAAAGDEESERAGAALQRLNALHKAVFAAVTREAGAMAKI